jgi:hypothetical protein
MVDLSSSSEKYQFNNAYTGYHKIIFHDEEVVSGTRSLWSVIDDYYPYAYDNKNNTASCVEILLFHNNFERTHQLWQDGQTTQMMLDNAPYLSRDNWQWTPDLFGLTDGDTIEIRIALWDDMDYSSKPDDWDSDEEWERANEEDMKMTMARREADRKTRGRRTRHRPTTQHTQPRSGLYNVLSQLETINVSSKRDEKVTGALESSNGSNGISIQKAVWRPQDHDTPALFYRTPTQRRQLV